MTNKEIEDRLAKVDQELILETRSGYINGVDYSWRGRTRRWRLNSLHCALNALLEYNKREHHNINSFCRSKKP